MLSADDVILVNETREGAEEELERWREASESRGLKVSRTKTQYMYLNKGGNGARGEVMIQRQVVPEAEELKYLGSTIGSDGKS